MHMGRSHHSTGQIITALAGGFTASFLTFLAAASVTNSGMRGQLVAGDPSVNREMPSTLNTMQAAMSGNDAILNAMGSYGWWVLVLIGGLAAAFVILKLMRRFA